LKAYRAARIVRVDGDDLAPGILLVRGEKVEAVLPQGASLPEGAEVVDLGGSVILPGLVNPISSISPARYRGYLPGKASSGPGAPRDARKAVAIGRVRPGDAVWRRVGMTGYTTLALLPADGGALIEGHASVIQPCRGGEKEAKDLMLAEKAYLFMNFSTGKTWHDAAVKTLGQAAGKIVEERKAKNKAEEEAKKKAAEKAEKKAEEKTEQKGKPPEKKQEPAKKPEPPDPLRLAFEGKMPVFLRVRSPAALDHLSRFLESLPLPLSFVLVTGPQPVDIVAKIAAHRQRIRAVVLEPAMGREWETSIFVGTARLFLEHGIETAFVPMNDSIEGFGEMLFHLAEMVKSGVRPREALQAVTVLPAKLLGLESRVGSLGPGRFADFAVYDRDPLSGSARVLRVFVRGTEVFSDDPRTNRWSGEAVR
jgi:hypothetical protein